MTTNARGSEIYNGEERIGHYNQGRQFERWVNVAGTK